MLKGVRSKPDHWQYGVGVPKGEVARSAAEAEKIAKEIGMSNSSYARSVDSS